MQTSLLTRIHRLTLAHAAAACDGNCAGRNTMRRRVAPGRGGACDSRVLVSAEYCALHETNNGQRCDGRQAASV